MSWKTVALGELCEVLDSKRKPITKRDRTEGNYPYYGATGIVDYVGDYIFDEKLVLIGEDGAKWDSGEKTAFIADGKYWVNNHAHVIKPIRTSLLDEWLVYYFLFKDLKEFVTGLTVPKLNQGQLKNIPIPLPPLTTQQKIVAKLDAIFTEIDKATVAAEANVKNAEALFQSYLTQVIEGGSKNWREFQIKELGKVITGNTPKKSEPENYGDFISFVKPGDFNSDGTIDLEKQKLSQIGMSVSRVVKEKSALMVCIGATIGKCGFVEVDVVTNQQINSVTPNSNFSHKFIYLQMLTSSFQKKIIDSSGQATLPIINKSKWESLTMKFPPLSKQLEIVERFENLGFETQNLKNSKLVKIRNTHLLKQSILKQAFNGELVKAA